MYVLYAKQKHLGCKKVRGQSEATCKQADATRQMRPKALISAEAKKLATLSKKTFNSLNDIQYFIVYFSRLALSLGHLYNNFGTKRWPSDKANREKYTIKYCMSFKELKVFFDKVANFLASADSKAFGRTCLLACCF